MNVLSESLMHLPLRLIFCRRCLNFINVRAAYASKIQAPPTKNPLANSGTTRFREHITLQLCFRCMHFPLSYQICSRIARLFSPCTCQTAPQHGSARKAFSPQAQNPADEGPPHRLLRAAANDGFPSAVISL